MRTLKETAEIVEKTISEIKEQTTKEMKNNKNLRRSLIEKVCLKYNISERHIRKVAGWNMLVQEQ